MDLAKRQRAQRHCPDSSHGPERLALPSLGQAVEDLSFFCQHPETETIIDAIKETGRIEWLNYDKTNHVPMDYLAQAKDPDSLPRCKVPTMVMFPEDDMFLWKTQAIDTPRYMEAECRIEIIQGGHWSMLDHPDDVNKRTESNDRGRCSARTGNHSG